MRLCEPRVDSWMDAFDFIYNDIIVHVTHLLSGSEEHTRNMPTKHDPTSSTPLLQITSDGIVTYGNARFSGHMGMTQIMVPTHVPALARETGCPV